MLNKSRTLKISILIDLCFFLTCVHYVYLYVWVCGDVRTGIHRVQYRIKDSLELKLEMVVLRAELKSSTRVLFSPSL